MRRQSSPFPPFLALILAALAVAASLSAAGCGNKIWPEPQAAEDKFSFASATAVREKNCLFIEARIAGAVDNLSMVTLQLADLGKACEDCPFWPDAMFDYYPGGQDTVLSGDYLKISHCGLNSGTAYQWRLAGHNSYKSLNVVLSPIQTTKP